MNASSNSSDRKDLLTPIRELLSDPQRWTQGCCARDSNGENVMSLSDKATSWCLYGAELKTGYRDSDRALNVRYEILRRIRLRGSFDGEGEYNDATGRTHADIMDLLAEPFYGN